MTFALGLRLRDGVVALADTRVVRGEQHASKAKLSLLDHDGCPVALMTSGLRSIRDKVVLRLEDELAAGARWRRLHELADRFGAELRTVHAEDAEALAASGLGFDLHAIIGGRLSGDEAHELILVYPQGNWIVATIDLPYFVIGRSAQGKPVLDRFSDPDMPLGQALALAYVAFDATRASVTDVDFPIDVVTMTAAGTRQARFELSDLAEAHAHWHDGLAHTLGTMPTAWAGQLVPGVDDDDPRR